MCKAFEIELNERSTSFSTEVIIYYRKSFEMIIYNPYTLSGGHGRL